MILFALAALLQPAVEAPGGPESPQYVNNPDCKQQHAYLERSLEIATRASKPTDAVLERLVAPDAQFELWDGDATIGIQGTGASAARQFFKAVNSTSYVVRKGTAPICVVLGRSAGIEFVTPDGKRSIFVTFEYGLRDSRLQRVRGETTFREEGQLRAEAERG